MTPTNDEEECTQPGSRHDLRHRWLSEVPLRAEEFGGLSDADRYGGAHQRVRQMWQLLEPLHAVVYFAPEATARYKDLGLKGFWMGYFASRSHPLGAVNAAVVEASFFNFHPQMVRRALPDAWKYTTPEQVGAARLHAAVDALRRLLDPVQDQDVEEAAWLATAAVRLAAAQCGGRPLAAAYATLPWPTEPLAQLWHAATILREHRGDGHVMANVVHGVSGLASHVLLSAAGTTPRESLQPFRGWTDEEWTAETEALREQGWMDVGLTQRGAAVRRSVEQMTDDLAAGPWAEFGAPDLARLQELVGGLSRQIVERDGIPVPNPMGVPWPPMELPLD